MVPVAFKDVTPDGKLVAGDVFLDTTLKNLSANGGKIAISVYDAQNLEGYKAIRSRALCSMLPRARSSRHLRLW